MTYRSCGVCVKRQRDRGGNDACPLPERSRDDFERGLRECRYFLLGDRRVPPNLPIVLTEELF